MSQFCVLKDRLVMFIHESSTIVMFSSVINLYILLLLSSGPAVNHITVSLLYATLKCFCRRSHLNHLLLCQFFLKVTCVKVIAISMNRKRQVYRGPGPRMVACCMQDISGQAELT